MIFDLHNDIATQTSVSFAREYYKNNVEHKIVTVFWTTKLQHPVSYISDYIGKFNNQIYAIEDMNFVDTSYIDLIKSLPIFYCGLVWNYDNNLGGGAYSNSGLTTLGKEIAKILSSSYIAIDTAHMSKQSFYDAIEFADIIINSHTAQESIFLHKRNIDDEQIKIVLSKGGLIGLTMCENFMGRNENCGYRADYIRQIDTYVQKFGTKGLCIGTDFFGTSPISGLESYSDIENIRCELCQYGYSQSDINNIFYQNANNFYGELNGKRKKYVRKPTN